MSDVTGQILQLAERLNQAFSHISVLAEKIKTLSDNDQNLVFQIETARGETIILLKVVSEILARECLKHQNPEAMLSSLVAPYFQAADVFAPDPEQDAFDDELRRLGVDVQSDSIEERKRSAAIAESYRAMAEALRDEAMKFIKPQAR